MRQWLDRLEHLDPTRIRLGLERVSRVYRTMGIPRPAPLVIAIGGTNGKGSCVAMLESIMTAAGLRVGAYTSPHILRFNERLRLDRRTVDDETWRRALVTVEAARAGTPLTYFEFITLAAIAGLASSGVDVALLEVGLGGRLDAVNVVAADAALVVSVDLDHTAWLGQHRETIGVEKAGLFHAGCVAVCGDVAAPTTVGREAARRGAIYYERRRDFDVIIESNSWRWVHGDWQVENLPSPNLLGVAQIDNAAACLMVIQGLGLVDRIGWQAIRQGLTSVQLDGRLQRLQALPEVVVDVAHNPAACAGLADWLALNPKTGRTAIVIGLLKDKDVEGVVQALIGRIDLWYCVALASDRALPVGELAACVTAAGGQLAGVYGTVDDGLDAALTASQTDDRILACGSFICVAAVLARYR